MPDPEPAIARGRRGCGGTGPVSEDDDCAVVIDNLNNFGMTHDKHRYDATLLMFLTAICLRRRFPPGA